MQPTGDDLRALSEHVLYEIEMLFRSAELLELHVTRDDFELPWAINMAQIESFAIHARALHDFLFQERGQAGKKTDGFAADYFEVGRWRSLRRPPETTLDPVREQVGQQIAHISYNRATLSEEAKQWRFAQIAASIGRPLRVFLEHVPESLVITGFHERVWRAFPAFLRQPVALSLPPLDSPPPTATRMFRPGEP